MIVCTGLDPEFVTQFHTSIAK